MITDYYGCVPQCSFSVCLKTWKENQRAVDEFADQWRVRAADADAGDPADPFDCFYDASDPSRVIPHKTYSRADVVHCMLWPSLVVVASAVAFLYLEARRSRLTFCGKRPAEALNGEKSQLKPAAASSSPSSHHATRVAKQPEHKVNDDDRRHHGMKSAGGSEAPSKMPDPRGPRHKYERHRLGATERLNGQVRSSVDVSVAGTSPIAADSPSSRRARRLQNHPSASGKSYSASSLVAAGGDTEVLGRPAGFGDGRRATDDDSGGRRPLSSGSNDDKLIGAIDSTPGRCVSESRLNTAI